MRQPEFDMMPKKERKPPIKRAHMSDAGGNDGKYAATHPHLAAFTCKRCGWESKWLAFRTVTEVKAGIPCKICNK